MDPNVLHCVALKCPQEFHLTTATEAEREREREEARALGWWIWSTVDVDTDFEGAIYCPEHAPRYAPRSSTG